MEKINNGQLLMKMNSSAGVTDYSSDVTGFPQVAIIILNWNGWK